MQLPLKMRLEYLSRRRSDLETLRSDRIPLKNLLKTLGHQIRGNARSYGFETLEPLALRMESIDENSTSGIRELISDFEAWIEREESKLSLAQGL